MNEGQRLVGSLSSTYFRIEADPVNCPVPGHFHAHRICECRQEIGQIHKMLHLSRLNPVTPADDERDVGSEIVGLALAAALTPSVLLFGHDSGGCSIVGAENEYGIVPQAFILEIAYHLAHLPVHIGHHCPEIGGILRRGETAAVVEIPFFAVRSCHVRRMYQWFSVIE